MPNKHSIVTNYKSEGGTAIVKTDEFEGDLSVNLEADIPAGAVDYQVNVNIPLGGTLLGFALACRKKTTTPPQTGKFTELTVKTNSASAPSNTFTLTPTNGVSWSTGDGPAALPLAAGITSLWVTSLDGVNPSTCVVALTVRALNDATPA